MFADGAVRPGDVPARGHAGEPQADPPVYRRLGVSGRAHRDPGGRRAALPCTPYDRLSEVDQGAVIEHKRLGHALQVAQALQAQRDDRRASGSPSRANQGVAVRTKERPPGAKKQREFTQADVNEVIVQVTQQNLQPVKPSRKPRQRSARPG